jgi:SPP1 family predicted phage head-tail adaptor
MARFWPIDPGERDRLIVIQQLADSAGGSGFPVETWTPLASVYAKKSPLTGREQFGSDQDSARADTRWEIGYRTDMDPDVIDVPKNRRISYQGRFYNIAAANEIGRRDGIELLTFAKVG